MDIQFKDTPDCFHLKQLWYVMFLCDPVLHDDLKLITIGFVTTCLKFILYVFESKTYLLFRVNNLRNF